MKKYAILVFLYRNFATLNTNPELEEPPNLFNIDSFDLIDPFNLSVYFNENCFGLDFSNEINSQCIETSSSSNAFNSNNYKIHVQEESNFAGKSLSTSSEKSSQNIRRNNGELNFSSDFFLFNSPNQEETTIKSNKITEKNKIKYKLNVSDNFNFVSESKDETKTEVKSLSNCIKKIEEIEEQNKDSGKKDIQVITTILNQNYPSTYEISTKLIPYKFMPGVENTTKKRKFYDFNLGNSSESEEKHDIFQLNSKKICLKSKTLLINEKHETNKIISDFEPLTKNEYSLLERFAKFLYLVECSFNNFLLQKQDNTNLSIQNVLYAPKFVIIDNFETDIYKYNADDASETCKEISTTFDVLFKFIQEFQYSKVYSDCLIDCIDPNLKYVDVTEVAKEIEFLIFNFLKSTEANYIISFLPELKSYVNATQKIEITYNENVIKGLIIILFICKRNTLNLEDFKVKINVNCEYLEIKNNFSGEILINSVFLGVFLRVWPFQEMHNIILNISTIIMVNCAIKDEVICQRFSDYIILVLISEHLFFELMIYNISIPDKHLSKNRIRAKISLPKNKEFKLEFWNLIKEINKFKLKEFQMFEECIDSLKTTPNTKAKNLKMIKDKDSICLCQIRDLLNLINRYKFYELNKAFFMKNLLRGNQKLKIENYFENNKK